MGGFSLLPAHDKPHASLMFGAFLLENSLSSKTVMAIQGLSSSPTAFRKYFQSFERVHVHHTHALESADSEMLEQLQKRRSELYPEEATFTEGVRSLTPAHNVDADLYVLDSATHLMSNTYLTMNDQTDDFRARAKAYRQIEEFAEIVRDRGASLFLWSSSTMSDVEVRTLQGKVHQLMLMKFNTSLAHLCDHVVMMVGSKVFPLKGMRQTRKMNLSDDREAFKAMMDAKKMRFKLPSGSTLYVPESQGVH